MDNYVITEAQYREDSLGENCGVFAIIDGVEMHIPLDPANRHYAEIMRQVGAGTLTIAEAD